MKARLRLRVHVSAVDKEHKAFVSFFRSSSFCDVKVQFERYSISEATHAFLVLDYNYANLSNWAIYMI